jgi:L-fuconolactonase
MRIDAHHHFWTLGRYDCSWMMQPRLKVLQQDYGPKQLQPLLVRHRIERSILVQTIHSLPETRWFLELARAHPFVSGVVGWVDLTAPSVGDTLEELRRSPCLVGIRHLVHDEPDVNWLLRPEVQRGLGELARRRLPYELLLRPPHLGPALAMARSFPELPLVVDHLAKPRIAQRGWDDWAGGLKALAQCPNLCCKLSGMITEADWPTWQPADLKPYIDYVLELFGLDRVMYGSDWPVCLLAGSYDRVIEALETNVAHLTRSERDKLFGLNAAKFYGLTPHLNEENRPGQNHQ